MTCKGEETGSVTKVAISTRPNIPSATTALPRGIATPAASPSCCPHQCDGSSRPRRHRPSSPPSPRLLPEPSPAPTAAHTDPMATSVDILRPSHRVRTTAPATSPLALLSLPPVPRRRRARRGKERPRMPRPSCPVSQARGTSRTKVGSERRGSFVRPTC